MTYNVRNEGRVYIAERPLYVAAKGSVPIGFARTRTESIPVIIGGRKHKGGEGK
jgi:hypothetical protein